MSARLFGTTAKAYQEAVLACGHACLPLAACAQFGASLCSCRGCCLRHDRVDALAAMSLNEHCAMVEKLEAEEICKEEMDVDQISNLANYFIILPSEVAMKFWTVLGSGLNENTIAFHQTNTDDGAVSSSLVKMMTGKSEPETEEV